MKDNSTFDKGFWKSFGWFVVIALLICCLPWCLTSFSLLDFTDKGQIGDTIGGIMGPFIAMEKFLRQDAADIYLAAYAATDPNNYTVVSFEVSNHNGSSEFKLPDVCNQFGVKCIPFQDMFRELHETY